MQQPELGHVEAMFHYWDGSMGTMEGATRHRECVGGVQKEAPGDPLDAGIRKGTPVGMREGLNGPLTNLITLHHSWEWRAAGDSQQQPAAPWDSIIWNNIPGRLRTSHAGLIPRKGCWVWVCDKFLETRSGWQGVQSGWQLLGWGASHAGPRGWPSGPTKLAKPPASPRPRPVTLASAASWVTCPGVPAAG